LPTSENYLHNNPTPDDHHQYLPIKEEMLENEESSFFKMSSGHPDHHHHHSREFISGKFDCFLESKNCDSLSLKLTNLAGCERV